MHEGIMICPAERGLCGVGTRNMHSFALVGV